MDRTIQSPYRAFSLCHPPFVLHEPAEDLERSNGGILMVASLYEARTVILGFRFRVLGLGTRANLLVRLI